MTKKAARRAEPAAQADVGAREPDAPLAGANGSDASRATAPFPIVGVGASAGGLEAFTELLEHLPLDTGMGFVLVQHLDPVHESALTQLLARATKMPVNEAADELRVEPNHVYVIPPNTNLSITKGALKLQPREKSRTPHRSIDFFLESLAEDQRERAVGVILSGTATDGTLGLEAIKAEGGITFAQDDSAKYDSMPRSAAAAGCVDFVLAPEAIANELARLAKHPYIAGAAPGQTRPEADHAYATTHQDDATALPSGGSGTPDVGALRARGEADSAGSAQGADVESAKDSGFKRVLALLRNHCGVDFSLYKSSTIQRRIARRMLLCRNVTLADYAQFLKGNAKELDSLFSDVLISVTSFFRNPDAFDVLQREVLPKLLAQRGDDPLRVWVLGCSTGQEAYSIAMSFVEAAEKAPGGRKLQVFATDLNDALLDKARHGLYAKSLAADLSPERLRRFFVEEGGGYRVAKPLREMVVFARQNLINDPPFSRIDIITCRNLLIYLEPSLQKKVFPVFHYALKPHGFLWLGASESIGGFTELFEPLDRKQKIYTKKAAATPAFALPIGAGLGERGVPGPARDAATRKRGGAAATELEGFHAEQNAQREADRITVNQFAPPGVLINAERQILQFRGVTAAYLQPPTGIASFDVLKMAREGLMLPLRSAIVEAAREMRPARRENVRIEDDGATRSVDVEVVPLKNLPERSFLILFEDADKAPRSAPATPADAVPAPSSRAARGADKRRVAVLECDLAETREYLQSIQETHEASNEELQAASEEVQSANEELQSLNEELTTSKEELESSNEELSTLNQEMTNRNAELSLLGNDLVNVQTSAHLVIVLLGRDLTIRRFSAQAEKQLHLLASDIGRPIGNIRHHLGITDLEALITEVIETVLAQERELRDNDGRWYSLRVRPYVTLDNRVDGAVLVLVDIDTVKRSERELFQSEAQYRAMFEVTSVGVTEADPATGRLLRVNQGFAQMLGCPVADVVGKTFLELTHADDRPGHREGVARLVQHETASFESEQRLLRQDGTSVWVHVTINLVRDAAGDPLRAVAITLDITERRRAQDLVLEGERRFRAMIDALPTAVYTTDAEGLLTHFNPAAIELAGRTPQLGTDRWCITLKAFRADGTLLPHDESPMAITLATGRAVRGAQALAERPDGTRAWFRAYPTPLHDAQGRLVGGINMLVDITESKLAEASLRESDRHKNAFLAMLAHELRNPLAPIRNALQIMRRAATPVGDTRPDGFEPAVPPGATARPLRVPGRMPESGAPRHPSDPGRAIESAVRMMERQVAQMVRLVDDLLDVSRISLGKIDLRLERVGLEAVVHQVEQAARPLCESMGHEMTIELPPVPVVLNADPARLVQIIGNLVNNACKFTERGGRIALTAEVDDGGPLLAAAQQGPASPTAADDGAVIGDIESGSRPRAPNVVIRVRDNGIGIAPVELPRIFQMFMQVDSSLGRSAGGLGIGLALVKDLVALHGGTVAVRSAGIGQGSEFEVRLPIAGEAPASPAGIAATIRVDVDAVKARRILVVDDNRDAAESIAELLQSEGHETHLAYDGLTAVAAAARFAPDVVLLDIGLPGIDGYEAARRIRAQNGSKPLLLIALTGWGQSEDRVRTARAGFDAHLVKPVDFDELVKLLG